MVYRLRLEKISFVELMIIQVIVIVSVSLIILTMLPNIHTIVVGSGMAGMGAANQLAKNGFKVLVLECNKHIGGRTSTIPVKMANQTIFPFDLGANWIHKSQDKHPITKLSQQMGNVKLVFTDDQDTVFYDEQGRQVDDQVDEEQKKYNQLMQKMQEIQNVSVYDAIKQLDEERLSNKFFMYNISYDIQLESSGHIQDISAQNINRDSQFGGEQMMVISGYQAFPEYLGKHPNIKVLTNHQVAQISSNGSKSIVKCSNGQVFQAPNVIVGVPLGALKGNNIRFSPELPPWKKEAIQKIHFGNVCKILVVLKKPINRKETNIGVVIDDIQKRGCASFFYNLQVLANISALMTFGVGTNSEELQKMPQNQLKELIASRLRVFSDQSFTANDFDIVRTSWRSNPNFRGVYSYPGVQTKSEHWQNMAKPIFERKLYFCGQHTFCKYNGSVHGAYLSGIQAASNILQQIDEENWEYKGKEQQQGQEQGQQQEQEQAQGQGQVQGQRQAQNQEEGGKVQVRRVEGKKVQGKRQGKNVAAKSKGKELKSGPNQVKSSGTQPCCQIA